MECECGKGYASDYDNICCFCREHLVSRAVAKKAGVRHRGDGMSIDQYKSTISSVGEVNLNA